MEKFTSGLKSAWKGRGNLAKIGLVLGNEAGDLDSVVSSVVLAYFLAGNLNFPHFPVMNFRRRDLVLKTEVKFCFDKWQKVRSIQSFKKYPNINRLCFCR